LAALLPNLHFATGGMTMGYCDSLFVGIAVKLNRVGDSILVVEEIQTIVCHSPSLCGAGGMKSAGSDVIQIKIRNNL